MKIKQIQAHETYNLRHKVMWPNKSFDFIKLENDDDGLHFGLFKKHKIISVISLFINDNSAQFRKFATENSEQGKGYGSILLDYIMTNISDKNNIDKIWCNARVDKAIFYEKFGMIKTDNRFVKADINYIIMEKTLTVIK